MCDIKLVGAQIGENDDFRVLINGIIILEEIKIYIRTNEYCQKLRHQNGRKTSCL